VQVGWGRGRVGWWWREGDDGSERHILGEWDVDAAVGSQSWGGLGHVLPHCKRGIPFFWLSGRGEVVDVRCG